MPQAGQQQLLQVAPRFTPYRLAGRSAAGPSKSAAVDAGRAAACPKQVSSSWCREVLDLLPTACQGSLQQVLAGQQQLMQGGLQQAPSRSAAAAAGSS